MRAIIENGLLELDLLNKIPLNSSKKLAHYGALLLEKNKVMNLTAIRDVEGVANLHMLDSAILLNYVDLEGKRLIDVGTGAGFPGMVLKALVPTLELTLLDSLNKRLDWLQEVAVALKLGAIATLHARAEEQALIAEYRDSFDVATARAVAPLSQLIELCLPFVKIGGLFVAMKGIGNEEELEGAAASIQLMGGEIEAIHDYTLPNTNISHRIILIRKVTQTPDGYPRKWAKIQRKPI